ISMTARGIAWQASEMSLPALFPNSLDREPTSGATPFSVLPSSLLSVEVSSLGFLRPNTMPLIPNETVKLTAAPAAEDRVQDRERSRARLRELLRPHIGKLLVGFLAVIGEGLANLL